MKPTILHCDMNNFYASVELLDYPELQGKPMVVCGNSDNRHGIILAKSQEAKNCGIITAETLWQAKKKCPDLQCVPPHMEKYKKYSKWINEIYYQYTDLVEPFSVDESWLDVTASYRLWGDGKTIADAIRNQVKSQLGLTLSAGVSFNKIFAKMGSEYRKPNATTVISPENFRTLLWPLPVGELFTVGKVTNQKLKSIGINTIGDLATTNKEYLHQFLGNQGVILHDYANGLHKDVVRPFLEKEPLKSVGNGMTFSRNLIGEDDIHTAVLGLSDQISSRLRANNLKAGGIRIEIKDPSFQVFSKQHRLAYPTNLSQEISKTAINLIKTYWNLSKPIRLLTVTGIQIVSGDEEEVQLDFFSRVNKDHDSLEEINSAVGSIRTRYGDSSISFGRLINNDIGLKKKE